MFTVISAVLLSVGLASTPQFVEQAEVAENAQPNPVVEVQAIEADNGSDIGW